MTHDALIYIYVPLSLNELINFKCCAYRQVSNVRHTLAGNKIVDHSDVVGTSYVGTAPTTVYVIFILNLTPGFIGLGKDDCKMRRETFKFCDLVFLILEILRYFQCQSKNQGIKEMHTNAISRFYLPGDSSFPLNALYTRPANRQEEGELQLNDLHIRIWPWMGVQVLV